MKVLLLGILSATLACATVDSPTPEAIIPATDIAISPAPQPLLRTFIIKEMDCPAVYQADAWDSAETPHIGRLKDHLESLAYPPLDNSKELICMQWYLLRIAADTMGQFYTVQKEQDRAQKPTIHPPYFGGHNPMTTFVSAHEVFVFLSPEAAHDWNKAYYQLAHEMTHVWDGLGRQAAHQSNYLAEGFAECFARVQSRNDLGMRFFSTGNSENQYEVASALVVDLLMRDQPEFNRNCRNLVVHNRNEIAKLREAYGSLNEITSEALLHRYPNADPDVIEKLVAPMGRQPRMTDSR